MIIDEIKFGVSCDEKEKVMVITFPFDGEPTPFESCDTQDNTRESSRAKIIIFRFDDTCVYCITAIFIDFLKSCYLEDDTPRSNFQAGLFFSSGISDINKLVRFLNSLEPEEPISYDFGITKIDLILKMKKIIYNHFHEKETAMKSFIEAILSSKKTGNFRAMLQKILTTPVEEQGPLVSGSFSDIDDLRRIYDLALYTEGAQHTLPSDLNNTELKIIQHIDSPKI